MQKDSPYRDEMTAIKEFEKKSENHVTVLPTLDNPHPIVAATANALSGHIKSKQETCSILIGDPLIRLYLSTSLVDRALRISDALFKALEMRGVEISTELDKKTSMNAAFKLKNVTVLYSMDEVIRRYPYKPITKAEIRQPAASWPKYRFLPTGLLRIRTTKDSLQGAIAERSTGRMESQLNDIICLVYQQAFKILDDDRRRKERDAFFEKRCARFERFQAYLRRKEEWAEELDEMISDRQKAAQIRELLQGMEEAGITRGAEWMAWAKDYADEIDPLILGEDSAEDAEQASPD